MHGHSHPYRVVRSEKIRAQLKKWGDAAEQLGRGKEYGEALASVEDKLRFEPLTWGDPLYPLREFKLLVFRGIHAFLAVHYGVNEEVRTVFVKDYVLLPGNPIQPE